jgi:hypothetical protein
MQTWFFTEEPIATCLVRIRTNASGSAPQHALRPGQGSGLVAHVSRLVVCRRRVGARGHAQRAPSDATCVVPAAPIMLDILARQTKQTHPLTQLPDREGADLGAFGLEFVR